MIVLKWFIKLYKHVFKKKTILQRSTFCEKYKLMKEFVNMQKIIGNNYFDRLYYIS